MSTPYVPPLDQTATQHDGTEHLAIKATSFRRLATRLALKTTALLFRRDGPCVPISKRLIVKTSPFVHLTEAATMKFVAERTSIPVPRIYCSFVRKNRAFIVMERVRGRSLPEAWGALSEADLKAILDQLKAIFDELRSLAPSPGTGVESCVGGSLRDSRIPRSRPRFGPFKTILDFHVWLREDFKPEAHPEREEDDDWRKIKDMISWQDGAWPAPVFTHGDLNPFNIMVDGGRVSGIIDWEFAGWYPYYWEYTSAWYGNRVRESWQHLITEFLEAHPEELEMEKIRQRWWGDL